MNKAEKARIKKLEEKALHLQKFAPVNVAILHHLYYDELPEDSWRDLYCEYCGFDRNVLESVTKMVLGNLHFIVRDIENSTPDELQEIIAEVEQMVNDSEKSEPETV